MLDENLGFLHTSFCLRGSEGERNPITVSYMLTCLRVCVCACVVKGGPDQGPDQLGRCDQYDQLSVESEQALTCPGQSVCHARSDALSKALTVHVIVGVVFESRETYILSCSVVAFVTDAK